MYDLQDYDAMVSLVEDMDAVPNLRVTNTVGIQNLYAFALNRRNSPGDRDKALIVIHKVCFFLFLPLNMVDTLCAIKTALL